MSTMDFLTIQKEIAAIAKMDLSDGDQVTLIKRWINIIQEDMNSRANWPWLESREIVQTVVEKTAGTVSISAGGIIVTGVGTAFASIDVGSFIQFSSSDDWYKIATFVSTTSLTIEIAYTGTSNLSGGTYTIRKVYYSLSGNVDKVLSARQTISPIKLATFHWRLLDIYKPNITTTGSPKAIIMFGMDSSRNWQFYLYPIPDKALNLEFRIKLRTTDLSLDADVPNISEKWVKTTLIDGVTWRALEFNRVNREDIRADKWKLIYEDDINKMLSQEGISEDIHTIIQSNETRTREVSIRYPDTFDISS